MPFGLFGVSIAGSRHRSRPKGVNQGRGRGITKPPAGKRRKRRGR